MGFFRRLMDLLFGPPPPTPGQLLDDIEDRAPSPTPAASATAAPVTTDPYTADTFTPLADEDIKDQAKQLGSLWTNPWFGRQDLIPPADDPRTQLIDRAMVSHGFITPEDLEDIHAIGADMDRVRPDPAFVRHRAQQLVAATVEEREERKRQKKAEAAERKRIRQEEIAHRRATDIVFLGRGVSKGLADRRANVEKLGQHGLPVLATPADVAAALSISISKLRWLAFHNIAAERVHYVNFEVPKKGGGVRTLSAPHRSLAQCQQWIAAHILNKVPLHDAAHGFVSGRSTVSGANVHVGAAALVQCDIKDFFPSVTVHRVIGIFASLGYSPAAATILALLCTECPRMAVTYAGQGYYAAVGPRALPQGACTSPALSNLVLRRFDSRLQGLAEKLDCKYTRYADDITFSVPLEMLGKEGWLLAKIRHIAQEEGFRLHPDKSRVQRRNRAQTVTGIVVNERAGVPRKTVRRLRAILHRAQFEGLEKQNREGRPHFTAWVYGMLSYIAMVNPQQAKPLLEAAKKL